ncbi:hypothetical protein Taro_046950 [Colocasia esculenta]|uniref:Uncharacterized protein n=1 Tax=Colocasia esculenta TaxID=4460 RepID=A0A843WRF3_COLES|nr:hypothetical protein [Colocasia esculenta]
MTTSNDNDDNHDAMASLLKLLDCIDLFSSIKLSDDGEVSRSLRSKVTVHGCLLNKSQECSKVLKTAPENSGTRELWQFTGPSETVSEIIARLKRDLPPTFVNGLIYWPMCDFITFRFVPVRLQPLVSNSFSFIWTIYITYMASLKKATTKCLMPSLEDKKNDVDCLTNNHIS